MLQQANITSFWDAVVYSHSSFCPGACALQNNASAADAGDAANAGFGSTAPAVAAAAVGRQTSTYQVESPIVAAGSLNRRISSYSGPLLQDSRHQHHQQQQRNHYHQQQQQQGMYGRPPGPHHHHQQQQQQQQHHQYRPSSFAEAAGANVNVARRLQQLQQDLDYMPGDDADDDDAAAVAFDPDDLHDSYRLVHLQVGGGTWGAAGWVQGVGGRGDVQIDGSAVGVVG